MANDVIMTEVGENAATQTVLDKAQVVVNEQMEIVRKALADKDLAAYNSAYTKLQNDVKELNKCIANNEYAKLLAKPAPITEAVNQFYIDCKKPKEDRSKDGETIVGVNLVDKKARIDLEALCDFGKLDKTWVTHASELLSLLTLRETDVFNLSVSDLSSKSFYFLRQVKAKQNGETPDSNTKIVRLLQTIIDEMIFVDNGNGQNMYKCTNHDLMFIHDAITKMDAKEKCTIATMNDRQFRTVLMSVLAHCLGETYKVKSTAHGKK